MSRPPVLHALTPILSLALLSGALACGEDGDDRPGPSAPGALVSVTPVARLEAGEVARMLEAAELDASGVRAGVEAFRIVYRTVDPKGQPTTASALSVFPGNGDADLATVSWMHGTAVYRADVASMNDESEDRAIAFLFASAGYAVSAPDYLGLGEGPGLHPYDDFDSAATVSLDALRATRTLAGQSGRALDPRVLVAGFSQGGPTGMALGRLLQGGADPRWSLGALAPIGGPFDVSGTLAVGATGDIAFATPYLAYLTIGLHRVNPLYSSPGEAFNEPYASTIETLFDGHHTTEQVFGGLPETLEELFTPTFLSYLRNPTGRLRQVLDHADSTCNWRPAVPVPLYAASGDKDVPIFNSSFCLDHLRAHGGTGHLIDLGPELDHSASVRASLPHVLAQFQATGI